MDDVQESESTAFKFDRQVLSVVYRKRLKYILVITLIAMLLGGIWAKVRITPTWRANCFVIRAPKNMSTPAEMPYLYQTFDLNTILETVRTRNVLVDVINKLRLEVAPEDLFKAIEVQRGNRSNVLKFSVVWNDRELAAQIANTTAEAFIHNNNLLQNSATLKIYNYYIQQQQARIKIIQDLEQQYEQFRGQFGVISIPFETQTKFDQLKEIEIKMIENSLRITEMETKIEELDSKIKASPQDVIRSWSYTETDEKKLLQLEKELEILRSKYAESNPKVKKVQKEIADLQQKSKEGTRDLPDAVVWGPSGLVEVYTIDRVRFEAEKLASIEKNNEFQIKVNNIRATLENLTQIQKEFLELERQLDLNRDVLRVIEGRIAEAKMAMQSNISDFEIIETAKAPNYPEGTRRKILVVVIGVMVFTIATVFVVGNELLDFSIKSELDFTDVIKIPMVGQLPDEDQFDKNIFYRNLQVLVDNIVRLVGGKPKPVICFGSDIPETGKSFLIDDIIKMLIGQKKKILYIDSIHAASSDIEPFIINDWLYQQTEEYRFNTSDSSLDRAYFLADDSVFTSIFEHSRIRAFFDSLSDYDYVFWELFDCHYNVQLFTNIASASDLLIMVGRFKRSSRHIFANLVRFSKERKFKNIYGVLNYVHKDYFQEKF